MKRKEIQSKAKERLRALNIIGIDRGTLEKAKAQIEEDRDAEDDVPSEGIPLKGISKESIPPKGIPDKVDVDVVRNFCKVDADVLDKALPSMDAYEQSIYVRLYRLSYGYGKNSCTVGYNALVKSCGMTRNGVIKAVKRLVDKGWVNPIGFDRTQGTTYRVYLPVEIGMESKTEIVEKGIPLKSIPNKGILPVSIPSEDTHGVPHEGIPPEDTRGRKVNPGKASGGGVPLKGVPSGGRNIEDLSIDLSPGRIVSGFYNGIGQKKISRTKRERGEKCIRELLADGFSLQDIQFAAQWTIGNATEKPYDCSILKHTIGQAMAAKKKAEAGDARKREKEKIAAQIEAEEKRRAEEEERIKVYKGGLDNEERARLRERAEAEIRDSGQYKEEFITEYLIEAKENNLIRERTGMKLSE